MTFHFGLSDFISVLSQFLHTVCIAHREIKILDEISLLPGMKFRSR